MNDGGTGLIRSIPTWAFQVGFSFLTEDLPLADLQSVRGGRTPMRQRYQSIVSRERTAADKQPWRWNCLHFGMSLIWINIVHTGKPV